jgi:small GTP-binding protein
MFGAGSASPVTVLVNRFEYKFMLWDTAGQERYRSIAEIYYRGVSGCFLIFDVTVRSLYEALMTFWLDSVRTKISTDVPVVLVGNKADMDRDAFRGEAAAFAEENNCSVAFTSALTGDGGKECLDGLVETIVNRRNDAVTTRASTATTTPIKACDISAKTDTKKARRC